jgi:hypothetical protein
LTGADKKSVDIHCPIRHIYYYLLSKNFNLSALIFILNVMLSGQTRELLGPRAKGSLDPSSNSPNDDTQAKSTTVYHKQGISTTKMN